MEATPRRSGKGSRQRRHSLGHFHDSRPLNQQHHICHDRDHEAEDEDEDGKGKIMTGRGRMMLLLVW